MKKPNTRRLPSLGSFFLGAVIVAGCNRSKNVDYTPPDEESNLSDGEFEDASGECSRALLEAEMTKVLDEFSSPVDFTFFVERMSGESYTHSIGSSTIETEYESASTSKLVSAAVILWTVENTAGFDLGDHPQEHVPGWAPLAGSVMEEITLDRLLSFTSGLNEDPGCLTTGLPPWKDFDDCVADIFDENVDLEPEEGFHYGSAHLQVAGAMAINASGHADWTALFEDFKSQTGLFPSAVYDLPRLSNPRLAGGMRWKASEYAEFIRALMANDFLSPEQFEGMLEDRVLDLPILNSPITEIGLPWGYGYGLWIECSESSDECGAEFFSSPGSYGAYPFFNIGLQYFGILARQGELGTFHEGIAIVDAVRQLSREWAVCERP